MQKTQRNKKQYIIKMFEDNKKMFEEITKEEKKILFLLLKDHDSIKKKIIFLMYIYPRYQFLEDQEDKNRFKTIPDRLIEIATILKDNQ